MVMHPSVSSPVDAALRTGDEGRVVEALRHSSRDAAERDRSSLTREIIALLRTTPSRRVRNAAALALADLGDPHAAEGIVDVLRRPEIADSSGTLLFALNELGASLPLSLLVHLVEHGSFEGRAEALIAMEEGRVTPGNGVETEGARRILTRLAEGQGDPDAAGAARQALEHLAAGGSG